MKPHRCGAALAKLVPASVQTAATVNTNIGNLNLNIRALPIRFPTKKSSPNSYCRKPSNAQARRSRVELRCIVQDELVGITGAEEFLALLGRREIQC